ncbi:MAG TPA: DUF1580 domain-containing protein [Tepidisphaeraceae bacterium]|nr:DUF1580 domain-containing protein [Tepidisphaeraceae bacterium]
MIDVTNETLLTLREAGNLAVFKNRKTGKRAHVASIYRFALHGAVDLQGNRVRLETIRTPGGQLTSRQAVERFIRALTDPDAQPNAPTPRQRQREIEAAESRLTAAGI